MAVQSHGADKTESPAHGEGVENNAQPASGGKPGAPTMRSAAGSNNSSELSLRPPASQLPLPYLLVSALARGRNSVYRSRIAWTDPGSFTKRKRKPSLLKMVWIARLSRNISATRRRTFSSRAT